MRKWRIKDDKYLAKGIRTKKWQSQDSTKGCVTPQPALSNSLECLLSGEVSSGRGVIGDEEITGEKIEAQKDI